MDAISVDVRIRVAPRKLVKVRSYKRMYNGKVVKVKSHYREVLGTSK